MRRPTHVALALAGASALALPAGAAAAPAPDPDVLAPVSGQGTLRELAISTRREIRRDRDRRRTLRLARRAERRDLVDLPAGYRVRLRDDSIRELASRRRRLRAKLESVPSVRKPAALKAIAACESGGDYSTNTGNGFYGAYQFDQGTWASVGGDGLPSEAPPAEQDARAAMLYARAGAAPWPVCGQ